MLPKEPRVSDVRIKVRESGPYLVTGPVTIVDCEGKEYTVTGENVALCRCGQSSTKPFCDGTHRTCGFAAVERAPDPADPAPQG